MVTVVSAPSTRVPGRSASTAPRFVDRQPLDIRGGRFVGVRCFVDVGREHLEGDARGRQQLRATRRAAGENYFAGWFSYHLRLAVDEPMQARSSRLSAFRCASTHAAAAMLFCSGAATTCFAH